MWDYGTHKDTSAGIANISIGYHRNSRRALVLIAVHRSRLSMLKVICHFVVGCSETDCSCCSYT